MATKRIKDLTNTAASVASDAYLAIDGTSNGTEKITRDNFRQDTADAFVAAPGTYNLAPLVGGAVELAKGGTGATTAAGARTNLSVNSIDEDAQANALKTTAPALYFNGTSSVVTVADDDKLSFTDGVDDLPFTISAFVKASDWSTNAHIVSKYGSSSPAREFLFGADVSGYLRLIVIDSAGTDSYILSNASMTSYNGEYVHVAVSYPGAGPNSSDSFSAATTGAKMFVNGSEISATAVPDPSYTGMSNSSQAVYLGRASSAFFKGSIRGVKIFNRELTSTEIAELARGNDLGFSEEWGGALGAVYTQDATPSGEWTSVAGADADEAGPIGGVADVLKFTVNSATGSHYMSRTMFAVGKRYRVSGSIYVPTQSNADGVWFLNGGATIISQQTAPALDSWVSFSAEFLAKDTTLRIYATDGGSTNFTDSGGDDVIYVNGLTVTEIGTLADFRAERYDTSTNKLYDLSDNAFVGTGTSVSLTGREVPVYETGTWTGVYEPTTGSFATMTMDTDLIYTRIGNLVTITGSIQTDNVDTTGGSGSLKITGLPFFAAKVSTCQIGFAWNWGTNFPLNAIVSGSTIYLYTRSSTTARTDDILVTDLSTGAVANRNTLYISATYKIQ
jgi:hypothetical protein